MSRDFFSPTLPFVAPSHAANSPGTSWSPPPVPDPTAAAFVSLSPSTTRLSTLQNANLPLSPRSQAVTSPTSPPWSPSSTSSSAASPSERVPFIATPPPHDPLLSQLNSKVTAALRPVATLHSQLLSTASSLSLYLTQSAQLLSSLDSVAPTAALSQYSSFHQSLQSAHGAAVSYYTVELLYPLRDWLEDAEELTVELGATQQTRHLLQRAQDELQQLFEMQLADAVPPSVQELIDHSKDGLQRLSVLYSGQTQGVVKSVERVLKGRERMLELVTRSLLSWEWKVMKGWRRIAEVTGRRSGEEDDDDDDEDGKGGADDEATHESRSASASPVPETAQPVAIAAQPLRLGGRGIDVVEEEDELSALDSPSGSLSLSSGDGDDSSPPAPASSSTPDPLLQSAASCLPADAPNFPYKAACKPSVALTPLPWRPLPLSASLSSSMWLQLFSTAYHWDDTRDELVCKYSVRAGAGKEEVERVWRRRRRDSGSSSNSKKNGAATGQEAVDPAADKAEPARLLSSRREAEVERVMRRVGMSAHEVVEALLAVDVERLTAERVGWLMDALPTAEERRTLTDALAASSSSSSSLLASLSPASLLLTSLISPIQPSLVLRLQCLQSYYSLPALSSSLLSSLSLLHSCCIEVRQSLPLQHTLCCVLELFNYLHPQQVAYAFDLSLLASLPSLAAPGSPPFLSFLIRHLAAHHPTLLSFPSSLASLPAAAAVDASLLSSQRAQLHSGLSSLRSVLDVLESSVDADDRRACSHWLSLYDRLLETSEKVDKRIAQCKAKAEELCRWLCWQGRSAGDQDGSAQQEAEEAQATTLLSCDVLSLLRVLAGFVSDFNAELRAAERRRRRAGRFHVNVREEKVKEALEEEQKRQRATTQREQQQQAANSQPDRHPAVLYSPYAASFSDLHERHIPPVESMQRNASMASTAAAAAAAATPAYAEAPVFSFTSRSSSGSVTPADSPMRRSTAVFSIKSGASSKRSSTAASPSGTLVGTPEEGGGGARASGSRGELDLSRSELAELSASGAAPVRMLRMPYQSHFTYETAGR